MNGPIIELLDAASAVRRLHDITPRWRIVRRRALWQAHELLTAQALRSFADTPGKEG